MTSEHLMPVGPPFASFVEKSLSGETRRKYRATIREFFRFVGGRTPEQVTPSHVAAWRDSMRSSGRADSTVIFKLSVLRSLFDHLAEAGLVSRNPADTKYVSPPPEPHAAKGRALKPREVLHLLAAPDRSKPEGARDYALMLVMARLGLRVGEACRLKVSSVKWERDRWVVRTKVKGGREEAWPLPQDIKDAIDTYLKLDAKRRALSRCGGPGAYLFQGHVNYRSLEFGGSLSTRMARLIVSKWGEYSGVGKVTPHDLRRTIVTELLDRGHTYRDIQMVTKHRDPRTIMRYDKGRENLERNPVSTFSYSDASYPPPSDSESNP